MRDAEKIIRAIGGVDEKYIEEASAPGQLSLEEPAFETVRVKKKNKWKLWTGAAAAAVAVAVGIGFASGGIDTRMAKGAVLADRQMAATESAATTAAVTEEAAPAEEPVPEESGSVMNLAAAPTEVPAECPEPESIEDTVSEMKENLTASMDNSEYLAKCASKGLSAGVPEYPECVKHPDATAIDLKTHEAWDEYSAQSDIYFAARSEKQAETAGYTEALKAFTETTAKQFLSGKEDNRVYSPLNIYMAMSMLAELTDGDSRSQILGLLGLDSIEAVREEARKLWIANYTDDGLTTLLLGSGVWVEKDFDVNYQTLSTLVEKYYAFYVTGSMQSEEMNQSFRDWLSAQTGGLLDDFVSEEKFDPETVLALASTIYYKAHWQDVFREEATEDAVFHAVDGDQTVPFLNETRSGSICDRDNFSATYRYMAGGEKMYFVLPNEGVSTQQILKDDQFWTLLRKGDASENMRHGVIVTFSVPKFDVSSGADLAEGLRTIGVTDVFDDSRSDFSPLTDETGLYVGKVSHNARVKIDEEGVEAAAYTAMAVCGSSMPTEYADFICDRPFIFVITNSDGAVLFMGTVTSIE